MAAVALLAGWSDPLAVLATHPDDMPYVAKVIDKAWELRNEREDGMNRNLAVLIANNLGPQLKRLIEDLARAMRG